jgi:SAM-dependent methyltransferase
VDLSVTAVENAKIARGKGLPAAQAVFIAADADKFNPEEYSSYGVPVQFDVIVFNEVLYYTEHKKMLLRYKAFLKPHGVAIISCFFKQNVNTIKDVIIADANVRTTLHNTSPHTKPPPTSFSNLLYFTLLYTLHRTTSYHITSHHTAPSPTPSLSTLLYLTLFYLT